jgi:hypothetical protein
VHRDQGVTGWEEVKRSLAEGRSSPTINGRLGERAPEEKEHEDTVSVLLLSSGRLGHRRKHEGHNCIYGSLERREAEHQRQERSILRIELLYCLSLSRANAI